MYPWSKIFHCASLFPGVQRLRTAEDTTECAICNFVAQCLRATAVKQKLLDNNGLACSEENDREKLQADPKRQGQTTSLSG